MYSPGRPPGRPTPPPPCTHLAALQAARFPPCTHLAAIQAPVPPPLYSPGRPPGRPFTPRYSPGRHPGRPFLPLSHLAALQAARHPPPPGTHVAALQTARFSPPPGTHLVTLQAAYSPSPPVLTWLLSRPPVSLPFLPGTHLVTLQAARFSPVHTWPPSMLPPPPCTHLAALQAARFSACRILSSAGVVRFGARQSVQLSGIVCSFLNLSLLRLSALAVFTLPPSTSLLPLMLFVGVPLALLLPGLRSLDDVL